MRPSYPRALCRDGAPVLLPSAPCLGRAGSSCSLRAEPSPRGLFPTPRLASFALASLRVSQLPGQDVASREGQGLLLGSAQLWSCPVGTLASMPRRSGAACLERAVSPGTGHRAPRVAGPPPVSRTEEVVRLFCSSGSVCSHSILPIVSAACTAGHIPVLSSLPGCSSFFIRQYQNCALCSGLLFPDVLPDSTASKPGVASKGRPAR